MRKSHITLMSLIITCLFLGSCNSASSQVTITPAAVYNPTEATIIDATAILNPDLHLQTPSGLSIDQYELKRRPQVKPLLFEPTQGSQEVILSRHTNEIQDKFPDNSFFENFQLGRKVLLEGRELIAQENLSNSQVNEHQKVSIIVSLDKKNISTIQAGDGSPITALQGLWTYNDHWALEVAYVDMSIDDQNHATFNVTGLVVQDGKKLNDVYGYQETFGFQLINGKPFYFFKKNGRIGISYADQTSLLGYEEIPHYQCCSGAEENPKSAKNIVSFFAHKDGNWYYVEIGVYNNRQT